MPKIDESQSYILVWPVGVGEDLHMHTMILHDLPESENTPVRAYTRDQLRVTDAVVTDANEAKALIMRATPEEPIAVPVNVAREMEWFPDAIYRGIEVLPRYQEPPR